MNDMRATLASESGFSGVTHALSAVAIILAAFTWRPAWYDVLFHTRSLWVLALMLLVATGGALMPDLDNTKSSAKSALGFIGDGLSAFMRMTAPMIQSVFHTKYDKDYGNAHRGFYHYGITAVGAGALFYWLCSMRRVGVVAGFAVSGATVAIVLAFVAVHIALSVLIKPILWKMRSGAGALGDVIPLLVSVGVVGVIWHALPADANYALVGLAFGVGWFIHEIGDCFTTDGDPILAPLKIRGKMMYDVRFLPIASGGAVEKMVIAPLLIVVIIWSLFTLVGVL